MANNEETEQRRRFRARPLRVDDPVPVFYFDNKKLKQEQQELYEWLLSADGQVEGQVQVVDVESRPVVAETWKHFNKNGAAPSIGVPGWHCLSSEEEDSKGSLNGDCSEGPSCQDSYESPYHRWVQRMPEDMMSKKEYVVDDDDDDWLLGKEIEEGLFEFIMDSFEKQHYQRLLNDRSRMYTESASGRFGLKIPDASTVLPLDKAVEELATVDRKDVELVHGYWVEKRRKADKPLLDRFMDEFPWSIILDHQRQQRPEWVNMEGPFVGVAAQAETNQAPQKVKQKQTSVTNELHRLYGIREDLERARTLADQVRKREKLKKHICDARVERLQIQMEKLRPMFMNPPTAIAACKEADSPHSQQNKKRSQSSKKSKSSEAKSGLEINKRVTRSEMKEHGRTKRVTRSDQAHGGRCTPQTGSETRISRSVSRKSGQPKPGNGDSSDDEASVKTGRRKPNRTAVKKENRGVKRTRATEPQPSEGGRVDEKLAPLDKNVTKRKAKQESTTPVVVKPEMNSSIRVTRSAAQNERNKRGGRGRGGTRLRAQPSRKTSTELVKKQSAGGGRRSEGGPRGRSKEDQANTRNDAKRAKKK